MARGFNLTAEINLRGPSNIRTVVADIRRQLGTVSANVNVRVDPGAARTINALNQSLTRLNSTLQSTRTLSNQAVSALNSLAGVGTRVNASIGSLPRNVQAAATAVNTLTRNTQASSQATQRARTEFEEFGRQSALAVRRFAAFALGTSAIVKLNNAVSSGIREFIAFDRELVRVSQVTGTSVKNLGSLVGQITSLSTSLGVTSEDLISVSSTLAQAGLSARDTEKALKALALSALAPSFDSLQDTVEGSIALMRQFGISAGDLEKALGSVNAVAAKFAVESGDIITAIQRTGGVFAAASRGVSGGTDALNEFIAIFTSVRQTTRESAETIATGLRTIFTRIQRGDTIDALKQYGVVLTDLEGKFVGPYEAVRRLAEGLNQLDPRDLRFSRIVEELGGFRQIGKVIPLIQQFTTAQQALIVAQRGQGSLATDAAIAQQALANKISKVREEFVGLIRSISQSQSFQNFIDLSLNLASALIQIADAAKSVLPALTAITAIRGASFLTQFATGFYGGMRRSNAPRGMATGGMVPGQGNRDTVPAMLTPGEFVIRKRAVEKIGVGRLARLNKSAGGPVQYLNSGGLVQSFAGGKTVKKSKKGGKEELSSAGPTEFTHIAARLTPNHFSPQLQKYFKSKKLNVSGIYSNMGLDLPMNWNRNWDLPRDNKGAFAQTLANYIRSKDVFKTLKSGSNKRWRFTGRGDSVAQNLLVDSADQIRAQLAQKVQGLSGFFDIDGEVSKILPNLLRGSIKSILPSKQATGLISGFEEKSAYKVGPQRKSITKEIRAQLKASGGQIQRFMAGQAVKTAKPAALSPQNLVIGPGYLKGGEWRATLQSLITQNGLTADPDMRNLMINGQQVALSDAFSSRQLSSAKLRESIGAANIVKLEKLRADVASAYSGKRAGVVEANRPRTPEEVASAQQKALLFGAAGMYGKRFPATEIVLGEADGLKQQTKATVFGALLDKNAAEREKRLQKRQIMLGAAGVPGGADAGTSEIQAAPTSKGLSKFFGYKASVTGVSKANKQLAMNTVGSIANALSPTTQGSQIFLDFDRTLAFGSDKIGGKINKKAPDYSAFGDPRQVAGGLANAKLSGLGLRLRKLVSDLDLKSPGLGNELLKRMFVVSARPAQTMPLIARWLRNQGLRIPPGNVSGVGGPGLGSGGVAIAKAEKMLSMAGPGSVFIDDDSKNIAAAREKGINSIQYGSSTSKKAKRQAAQQEGLQFEQFISEQLPANLKTGIFGTDGEGIDFPFGLGSRIAQYWFNDPRLSNIPVDTKRTLTGPRGKIKDNILSYLKGQGYNAGGMVQRFANAGPVEEYYGQREVEAARKSWSKFKSSVKKAFDSDKVYFDVPMAKSIAEGADPEVYGTGIGKLAKGEPGVISSKKIRLAKQKAAVSTDPREAARRKAVRKQDELAAMALKGLLGGLPQDKQKEVAALFGLSPGLGPSLMPSLGAGGAGAAEELAAAKQGVSALKKTGSLKVSKQFVDFFRNSLASYYLELKQAAMLDPSDTDLKKQLKKTRRAGVDVKRSLRTDEPIGVQGRRTAASETLSLMLKERFQGFAKGGSVEDRVPALLTPGEFVINKKAAQRIGASRLHNLNRADRIQGFNKGGAVGYIQKLAKGGKTEKLAEAVGSFDPVDASALKALDSAVDNLLSKIVDGIAKANPSIGFDDAYAQAQQTKQGQTVSPTASFGLMRQAETGDQQAANMVADAQRKQVNSIVKVIRAHDNSIPISQAKAAAERRVADAWGGLYKRTKEQEQQASLLSRAMARVSGLYGKIKGSDLTPEQREARQSRRDRLASAGMGLAFTAPMLADQAAQMVGGPTGQALSAATSSASTFVAIGTQLAPILAGPLAPLALLATTILGAISAVDSWNKALIESEIEINKTKIEKESQKSEKTLATLAKDPKSAAATQELINSLDAMSSAEKNIQDGRTQIRTQPTMMGRLKSLVGYDTTTPEEVQNNKEYQTELKKLQERNLNATEFTAQKRELVAKFTAQEVGQANAAQSKARSEVAMQALVAKGSEGLTIDEALGSFGSNAGKIQESIAAGSQKYAVELEKLVQDAATSGMSSTELDKRKKSLIQKYYLEETETLRAAMADQARAKAASKVAKALSTAVTSIERTFGNMEAALNRGANALSEASASLDAMAADKSNLQNAFAGQNILENPRAYSRREREGAVRQSAGLFGRDAGFVEKLTSTVGSDIKDSLTSIATRAQSTGASKEAVAQEIQRSVDQQLMAAFGNNDLTRQLSEQIKIQLETQMKNDKTDEIDLDQLLAASTGLTSLIDSEKKAFELLAQGTKQVTQALDIYTSKLVTATEMLNEVDSINAESISMRASNDFRLREMLGQGQKVPLRERLAARSQEAAARAGLKPNELNTQSLLARLGTLRQTRADMEQRRTQFQEGRSFTDPATMEGIQKFNAGLINLDNQIAKTKSALKNLPKDIQGAIDDVAGAMEDRLSKIESKREAGTGFAERMVTSTPTELANLGSTYNVLNNALNGQARTIQQSVAAQMAYQKVIQDGGTAVEAMTAAQSAYADENKQVFSLFNELVAVGGIDKQQANTMRADLLETMARSQGLNMQNNPLFNQIIANLRRAPEEDPEIKRLQTLYKQLQDTQQQAAEATRTLVIDDATALVKSAGDAVKTAIETARISFNEQQLADMGLGLSRPGQVMGKEDGGLIYASAGKLINFKPKGTDTVPAMLTPGEFVVNARATKQNLPLLQSINKSGGGPVQYFAAGTDKPVSMSRNVAHVVTNPNNVHRRWSMSRNVANVVTNPDEYRRWQDSVMRYGVPPEGTVRPNAYRATSKPTAATPRKPLGLSDMTPNGIKFEIKYLKEKLDALRDSDGTVRGRNIPRARNILNQIREMRLLAVRGASSPLSARPTTTTTASSSPTPAADAAPAPKSTAVADAAATPKPSTVASKPAPATSFVYDPDNLINADAPTTATARDIINQSGPLMDYDAIQPDAGGTMRTAGVKPKPTGGFFSGIMSRIGDMMGSGATTPRGPTRSSILPTSASLSERFSASAGDLVEGAYRVGQAAISDVRSGANYVAQSVKPIRDYLGRVGAYANAPYAAADAASGLLPGAGRGAVRAARAGAYVASSATNAVGPNIRGGLAAAGAGIATDYALGAMGASEGVRNATSAAIDVGTTAYEGTRIGMGAAAQARIFAELGIQSAYEVGSAVYDTQAYIDKKLEEGDSQQQARNEMGYVGGVLSNIGGNIFGTDASIYKPTTWIPGRGIPSAIGRASVTIGDTARARQSAADQKNTVDARQASMNSQFPMLMKDGETRNLGVLGEQWVRRRVELEENKNKLGDAEYNRQLANLEADKNAVDIQKGWFSNTSTRRMSASDEDLDYAYKSQLNIRAKQKAAEDAAAKQAAEAAKAEKTRSEAAAAKASQDAAKAAADAARATEAQATTNAANAAIAAARQKEEQNRQRIHEDASRAMAKPALPDYIDRFKELEQKRADLQKQYVDANNLVDPEQRKQERDRLRKEIDEIDSTVVKQQREASSMSYDERKQAWEAHNKAKATAEAKAQREAILTEKREKNDAQKRKFAAESVLMKISGVPAPRNPERVPDWRAKSLEKIRDKFNLSGDPEKDIQLMTAYGMSPELAKGLFRPLTEDQNKAVYELLSQQTQRGQYKYSDSDLQLLKMSRQQIMEKVNKGELKGSTLARKEILETAREKEFAKSFRNLRGIDSIAARGMSLNDRAQRGFRQRILKKLIKLGYIDPRIDDSINAQRLSALNLNANTVSFVYPAQVGGMLAGKVDNAQQKSLGGVVYASTGKLINFKPRGTDTVPAMLTPGEFVVNARATQQHLPMLQAINGGAKGFSSGGQVNYMADGGILGQLFAPMLGTFKGLTSAVQLTIQALQTYQKQLASTQPNSVSNTSGSKLNLDGLSEFTTKFDQFISALNSINIPPMVSLQVAPITVNITGAEALVAALEGPMGGMLQEQISIAMNRLSANTEGAIQV